jgi:hypothetical protein
MRVAAGKTNDSDTWLRNDRWSNRCISPGREDTVAAISSSCGTGCARCCVQQGDGDSTDPNRDSALSVLPFSERGRSERSHNHGCRLLQSLNHADSRRAVYRPNSKSDLTFQQNFDLDTAAETHTHTHTNAWLKIATKTRECPVRLGLQCLHGCQILLAGHALFLTNPPVSDTD